MLTALAGLARAAGPGVRQRDAALGLVEKMVKNEERGRDGRLCEKATPEHLNRAAELMEKRGAVERSRKTKEREKADERGPGEENNGRKRRGEEAVRPEADVKRPRVEPKVTTETTPAAEEETAKLHPQRTKRLLEDDASEDGRAHKEPKLTSANSIPLSNVTTRVTKPLSTKASPNKVPSRKPAQAVEKTQFDSTKMGVDDDNDTNRISHPTPTTRAPPPATPQPALTDEKQTETVVTVPGTNVTKADSSVADTNVTDTKMTGTSMTDPKTAGTTIVETNTADTSTPAPVITPTNSTASKANEEKSQNKRPDTKHTNAAFLDFRAKATSLAQEMVGELEIELAEARSTNAAMATQLDKMALDLDLAAQAEAAAAADAAKWRAYGPGTRAIMRDHKRLAKIETYVHKMEREAAECRVAMKVAQKAAVEAEARTGACDVDAEIGEGAKVLSGDEELRRANAVLRRENEALRLRLEACGGSLPGAIAGSYKGGNARR
ncbi:hypothetical protein UCDDS831_g07220 [Diplodia seriata]|uniref:Uncharacterized protein n=1 Tax=Diplodia seriata TaxID=420778 RepID=A0A0G2FWC5_9PEZI|nr:hypothetical protein UCDDS831_g07220 [Diplodia seriata]